MAELVAKSLDRVLDCTVVRECCLKFLRISPQEHASLHGFTLTTPHIQDRDTLTMQALLIYGTYTAFNNIKHSKGSFVFRKDAYDAIVQAIREEVRGHESSACRLRNRWSEIQKPPSAIPAAPLCSIGGRHRRLQVALHKVTIGKRKSYDHLIHWPSKRTRTTTTTPRLLNHDY